MMLKKNGIQGGSSRLPVVEWLLKDYTIDFSAPLERYPDASEQPYLQHTPNRIL